jgi:hypothetical protein
MAAREVPEEMIENKEKIARIKRIDVRFFDFLLFIMLINQI